MPARVGGRTHPFAAPGRSDIWEPLARRRTDLLLLVQNICARLLEERAPLFSKLDRIDQRDVAWDVRHFADNFEGRGFAAQRIKIEADGLGQLQLCDPIIVL